MIEVLQARSQVPRSAKIYYEKLVPLAYGFTWPVIGWCKWLAVWMAGLFRVTPRIPCSRSGMRLWATKTVALACENIMLALRAYGYDTCPMEGMDEVRIAKMLKLPRSANVVMVIGAGRRAKGGIYGPRIRFDDSQFVREV
jgi:nitroreductase